MYQCTSVLQNRLPGRWFKEAQLEPALSAPDSDKRLPNHQCWLRALQFWRCFTEKIWYFGIFWLRSRSMRWKVWWMILANICWGKGCCPVFWVYYRYINIYIYIYKDTYLIYGVLFIDLVLSLSYPGALHTWGSDTKVLWRFMATFWQPCHLSCMRLNSATCSQLQSPFIFVISQWARCLMCWNDLRCVYLTFPGVTLDKVH